jgi:hypothetical protein
LKSTTRLRKPLEGQLGLFDEPAKTDSAGGGDGLARGLPRGFYGKPFEVGFVVPILSLTGDAEKLNAQVWRDVETLFIGWPESEEEANFYRRRIRRYLKTIEEMTNE